MPEKTWLFNLLHKETFQISSFRQGFLLTALLLEKTLTILYLIPNILDCLILYNIWDHILLIMYWQ